MVGSLSATEVAAFRSTGYVCPVPVLNGAELDLIRRQLRDHEAAFGVLDRTRCALPHLLLTWVDRLIRHPAILDAMASVLGPNLLVWGTNFFVKEPRSTNFISWHQDSTYWGLEPPEVATAWLALTDSNSENGCVRVVPGSHLRDQIAHRDTFDPDNLLTRGQEIAVDVRDEDAVDLTLAAGSMSIHHVRLVHGSHANRSSGRRVGLAIRYLPAHVRQISDHRDRATLVRGSDDFGHFAPETPPQGDMHPEAILFHRQVLEEQSRILYR